MLEEFKKFIMRGNVLDLAIAVIMGGAFGKIVTSLVGDILMPVLSLLFGKGNFSSLKLVYGDTIIKYGVFIQNIVDFMIISFSIFVFIYLLNTKKRRAAKEAERESKEESPVPPRNEALLEEIRDLLKQGIAK